MSVHIAKRPYEIPGKQDIQACAEWFCEKYLDVKVNIDIFLDKRLASICGECFYYDDDNFDIYIGGKLPLEEIMITLCHELWHTKQYYEGKLRDMGFGKTKWNRKTYKDLDYLNMPWEIEAHEMETKILAEWRHSKEVKI